MFKNTLVKLSFVLMAVAAIAINTGCGKSILGPENESEVQAGFVPGKEAEKEDLAPIGFKAKNDPAELPGFCLPEDIDCSGSVTGRDLNLWDWTVACDVDGDGDVDLQDAVLITRAFGQTGVGLPEDVNNDERVDLSDFQLFAGMQPFSSRMDVDGNGQVTAADRNKIEHALAPVEATRSGGPVGEQEQISG